jgi:uncharacterized protein (TIGR04255 family)
MRKKTLSKAPLKEVLLEIHWDLDFNADEKILIDKGFDEAALNFTNACQQEFKEVELLKPSSIPPSAFIHRVTHRFFKIRNQHPLYQLGPGVFTINDNNKNYEWTEFRKMIENGISCLNASYEKELVPSKIELRYIDSVSPYCLNNESKFDFIEEHLGLIIDQKGIWAERLDKIDTVRRYNLDNTFELNLNLMTGVENHSKEDIVEWHTYVNNKKRLSWEEVLPWIENAHEICSDFFKGMVSAKLYEYFSK